MFVLFLQDKVKPNACVVPDGVDADDAGRTKKKKERKVIRWVIKMHAG